MSIIYDHIDKIKQPRCLEAVSIIKNLLKLVLFA